MHTWKKEQQQYGAVWSEHKSCKSAILFLKDGFFCWQPQIGIVFRYANPRMTLHPRPPVLPGIVDRGSKKELKEDRYIPGAFFTWLIGNVSNTKIDCFSSDELEEELGKVFWDKSPLGLTFKPNCCGVVNAYQVQVHHWINFIKPNQEIACKEIRSWKEFCWHFLNPFKSFFYNFLL